MSIVDENIKKVLELIDTDVFDSESSLPSLGRNELENIVLMCEEEGYISHRSTKGKPLVTNFMGGGWLIAPNTFVTRSGKQFLEGLDRNVSQISQTYNIQSVQNSALGNYNTVNNYSEKPVEELQTFVESLENIEDQKTGKELLDTLKKTEIKAGYLNKFKGFLAKYPKTVDLIASFTTSMAIGAFTS